MARIRAAAFACTLSACAATPTPEPRIVTQEVKVPVPVHVAAPAELLTCRTMLPVPAMRDAPDGILIPASEIPAFLDLVGGLVRCDDAWAAWATAP